MASPGPSDLTSERRHFQERIGAASEEDDPLAVYVQYVQWIINHYGENDPNSGLLEILEDATKAFKRDALYKTDLRYLKLWSLYAKQVDRAKAISLYTYLYKNEIGISYSLLYEEFAKVLEQEGRLSDAQGIYQTGISRQARPAERLKKRYTEFQLRHGSEVKNKDVKKRKRPSDSKSRTTSTSTSRLMNDTPESRYALMLAPPAPGKRPEKFQFDLSLLYTQETGEFCIQEARARSMGLLGKKWPPLPPEPSSLVISSTSSQGSLGGAFNVSLNDDSNRATRSIGLRRKSLMHGEPTVTINTKEALADVFGMYNSPDKTVKFTGPGSKHAAVRKIEPIPLRNSTSPEPSLIKSKVPAPAFQPFVDETSAPARKENKPTQLKFTPYRDPGAENQRSGIPPRGALTPKGVPSIATNNENGPRQGLKALKLRSIEEVGDDNVVSKVFTPAHSKLPPLAPLRDVFTDDHGKPLPKPKPLLHERAKSQHDVLEPSFNDENARTPFKVFSRPGLEEDNRAFTPKPPSALSTVTTTNPAFQVFRDEDPPAAAAAAAPSPSPPPDERVAEPELAWPSRVARFEEQSKHGRSQEAYNEDDDNEDENYDRAFPQDQDIEVRHIDYEEGLGYDEGDSYQERGYPEQVYQERDPPLGGRFGQFNVMTPITERTFEFTASTRNFPSTPSGPLRGLPEEYDYEDENQAEEDSSSSILGALPTEEDSEMAVLEEQTGKLSLADALTLSSNFKPPNPCNPFEHSIMSNLLSRLPPDTGFYDHRGEDGNFLEGLERFAKKARKTSGDTNSTGTFALPSLFYPLSVAGHKFEISAKLGEGGFGSVFRAKDLGSGSVKQQSEDDEDDEDEDDMDDEEGISLTAIKVVKPRNLWEYHVLRRIHAVLPSRLRVSVVQPYALYAFRDESLFVMRLCTSGSLLNVVNTAVKAGVSQQGGLLDELLVMFFSIELIRLVEALHNAGFIHGDLKIDNCLLRLDEIPGGASKWSNVYDPSGQGEWDCRGITLIDFGRTIDTRLFPLGQTFIADWDADERDCFEIQEGKPWTYQTDYFGLAGIVYCLLFGKYIQSNCLATVAAPMGVERHKIATPFKRYWQTEIWNDLFDVLLNPRQVRRNGHLPISDELSRVRHDMEKWLQENCTRTSNTLKGLLKKVEKECLQ